MRLGDSERVPFRDIEVSAYIALDTHLEVSFEGVEHDYQWRGDAVLGEDAFHWDWTPSIPDALPLGDYELGFTLESDSVSENIQLSFAVDGFEQELSLRILLAESESYLRDGDEWTFESTGYRGLIDLRRTIEPPPGLNLELENLDDHEFWLHNDTDETVYGTSEGNHFFGDIQSFELSDDLCIHFGCGNIGWRTPARPGAKVLTRDPSRGADDACPLKPGEYRYDLKVATHATWPELGAHSLEARIVDEYIVSTEFTVHE